MSVQSILHDLIEKHGLQEASIAEKLGVCPRSIKRWVGGRHRPTSEHVRRNLQALHASLVPVPVAA